MAASRVLVVHGSEEVARIAERSLRARGFEPTLTDDPEQATWIAAEMVPAAVVIDLAIARFDALDLAAALRGHPRTRAVRIVALVPRVTLDLEIFVRMRGCDAIVAAPVDGERIAREVERAIARGALRDRPTA